MSKLDEAMSIARTLSPADRLRLIERLWESMPPQDVPSPSEKELAEVYRRSTERGVAMMESVPWPIVERMIADCVRQARPKIYSAPRRFDLALIFVVTSIYAVLFAGMSALQFPPAVSLAVAGFITIVGVGQALLFRGRRPRTASLVIGVTLYTVPMVGWWLLSGSRAFPASVIVMLGVQTVIGGAILGYVAGVMVGGVFLLADVVRRRFRRRPAADENVNDDD